MTERTAEEVQILFKGLIDEEPVDLDPELQQYVRNSDVLGACIKHPLVYSMIHVPQFNGRMNKQLQAKKQAVAEALADQQWHSYVFLHERPWRIMAFKDIMEQMTDAQYWDLLGIIWTDSENIREAPQMWETLLRSKRPERNEIMTDDDQAALMAMDDVIPVYQGHTTRRHDGWSWTTNYDKAVWFAHRFALLENSKPALTSGMCSKADVIAYFANRGESEIVVPRSKVRDLVKIKLQPQERTSNSIADAIITTNATP
jgi:hypothetical protein